ncbi:HD family phosphohydrolase [Lignipirellula cremea]|uniref:HD/PDEase domain-containing protein n=1 Tax=Lignipirellula cremea TaxID=2528010 RepID=A0A518E250_9BACT|nr:HDIG domain-containing metalloprotein [Lignipirellula cremea]QDU98144.1 hypothetical protein Pla8534_60050 [Lignipirellula cremea]
MSTTGSYKRARSALELPPGQIARAFRSVRRPDVLLRAAICLGAAVCMFAATGGWQPAFSYRTRYVPDRKLTASTSFEVKDVTATDRAREKAIAEVITYYTNDPSQLVQLQNALIDRVLQVTKVEDFGSVDQAVWREFFAPGPNGPVSEEVSQAAFAEMQAVFASKEGGESANIAVLRKALANALQDHEDKGLLTNLTHNMADGNQTLIMTHPVGDVAAARLTPVSEVRIGEVGGRLEAKLAAELSSLTMTDHERDSIAKRLYVWLHQRLKPTLVYDQTTTAEKQAEAAAEVKDVMVSYAVGDALAGIEAHRPLTAANLLLLRKEHEAVVAHQSWTDIVARTLAEFGMYAALYLLCGVYLFYRDRRLLTDLWRFLTLLAYVVLTVAFAWQAARDQWRVELIPILLFGMTIAIAYRQDLALLLASAVSLVVVLSLGAGLGEFVIFVSAVAASIVVAQRIRTRTRLIFAGLWSALVAFATAVGVEILVGQPFTQSLLLNAAWYAFSALVASVLMAGLLPFFEKLLDFQTDLSLLELGDQSHPLLQELVRRAPGTYNHSINVASIGEAAAESIGANGLLVRVGAYFHDIGKMLKPGYFVENQSDGANRHDTLAPAMSTLVIIAHVKDGAELARQNGLPECIIDFIEQHHGTTLVEYFYVQAARKVEADPDAKTLDESSFRYPGPKPQTREAAVMMLTDAVESACRTLVDPGPARIESLVNDIAMKRLLDGQFDESALTLKELHTVQQSLIKSLTAVYHGRVKYPAKPQSA